LILDPDIAAKGINSQSIRLLFLSSAYLGLLQRELWSPFRHLALFAASGFQL
jgi:hypothetical protein